MNENLTLPEKCINRGKSVMETRKFVSDQTSKLKRSVSDVYPKKSGVAPFINEFVVNICNKIDTLLNVLPDFSREVCEEIFLQISGIVEANKSYTNSEQLLGGIFSPGHSKTLMRMDLLLEKINSFAEDPRTPFQYNDPSGLSLRILISAVKAAKMRSDDFTFSLDSTSELTDEQLERLESEIGFVNISKTFEI